MIYITYQSKIIYLISKVTIQSIDNSEYNKLINYLHKNSHIILFNDRINTFEILLKNKKIVIMATKKELSLVHGQVLK